VNEPGRTSTERKGEPALGATQNPAATGGERATALVRAAQRGDAMALADLLELLAPYVSSLCGPIALQDGPDAAQEALITVFRDIRRLREPTALYGWVRTIAVRAAVRTARRARTGSAGAEPGLLGQVPDPADPLLGVDIRDVLARLSPEHRAVLTLRELERLDERAVSEILAIPEGTVKSRVHRARRSFAKAWRQ
jgi:RNA polymerase sigma factor (sigma-70 family)